MEPLLRFENVSKHYPNGVHALKGVSFEMAEGEFISVIGPSGSGKSTLLRAINRLIPISGGTVWLDGQAVSAQRGAALRQLRRKVGMIFQNYTLVYKTCSTAAWAIWAGSRACSAGTARRTSRRLWTF